MKSVIQPVLLAFLILLAVDMGAKCQLRAQNPISLPRGDYYAAYDLLRDGQTIDANAAFRTALRPLNVPADSRSVEAIPTLVMLGESYYQMGEVEQALAQWEGALSIALRSPDWCSKLGAHLPTNDKNDPSVKGIGWWSSPRKPQLHPVPRQWPVVVGPNTIVIKNPGAAPLSNGTNVVLDALEILRCQAWALRRRHQILGEMAVDVPMTRELQQLFQSQVGQLDANLHQGMQIAKALSSLHAKSPVEAMQELQKCQGVTTGVDSYLSPVVMLCRADLLLEGMEFESAKEAYFESAYLAAAYGQHEVVAEAVERMGAIAAREGYGDVAPRLKELVQWGGTRSRWVTAAALSSLADLHATLGERSLIGGVLAPLNVAVGPRNVKLPRLEANGYRVAALGSLMDGKPSEAAEHRKKALELIEDDSEKGPFHLPGVRLRLAERLIRSDQWKIDVGLKWLPKLVENPSSHDWLLDPLGCIAFLHTDLRPALNLWLELELRGTDGQRVALAVDTIQRHAYYRAETEGGRLTALRRLVATSIELEAGDRAESNAWRQRLATDGKLQQAIEQDAIKLAKYTPQLDPRQWTDTQKNVWGEWTANLARLDLSTLAGTLARYRIHHHFPKPINDRQIGDSPYTIELPEDTCILGFYLQGSSYHGLLMHDQQVLTWRIGLDSEIDPKIVALLESLGVTRSHALDVEHLQTASWRPWVQELSGLLVPTQAAEVLARHRICRVVPYGKLWHLPFEMLNLPSIQQGSAWLAMRRLAYYPTLGQATTTWTEAQAKTDGLPMYRLDRTLGIVSRRFFAEEEKLDKQLEQGWQQAIPNTTTQLFHASTANKWQVSRYARAQARRIWVAGQIPFASIGAVAILGYDAHAEDGKLAQWLLPPLATPEELIIPGLEPPVTRGTLSDGSELFELACILQATGNRSALISRWGLPGGQTRPFIERYLESLVEEPASAAWQRAALACWEEPWPGTGKSKGTSPNLLYYRSIPYVWSSMMQIGDTRP